MLSFQRIGLTAAAALVAAIGFAEAPAHAALTVNSLSFNALAVGGSAIDLNGVAVEAVTLSGAARGSVDAQQAGAARSASYQTSGSGHLKAIAAIEGTHWASYQTGGSGHHGSGGGAG